MEQQVMGQFVKRMREQKPWTQEQLAGAAELSVRTVQRVEEGAVMGAETLQALAGALGVNVEEIRRGSTDAEARQADAKVKDFLRHNVMVELSEVKRGHELGSLMQQAPGAHLFHTDDTVPDGARKLLADFQTSFTDWSELWSELPANQRFEAEQEWDEFLLRLRDLGCTLTGGTHSDTYRVHESERGVSIRTLYLIASPANAPKLVAAFERGLS